ncbi:MAG: hypothetical protein ACPGU1_17665 [Myxococcota bacterium]
MDSYKFALLLLALAMGAVTAPAMILALSLVVTALWITIRPKVREVWQRAPVLRRMSKGLAVLGVCGLIFLAAGYTRTLVGGADGEPSDKVSFAPYGAGYSTYSWLGNGILGRQYARRDVREVLEVAFASRGAAGRTHVLAEVGSRTARDGERRAEPSLWGHHSHKSGVAVDVHLPVLSDGEPTTLPSNLFTLWGYGWRFDRDGRSEALAFDLKGKGCSHRPAKGIEVPFEMGYELDLEELAHFLAAVHDAAKENPTTRLKRVILWPPLRRAMKKTAAWKSLFGKGKGRQIRFNQACEWVIHDEHVHLHFSS